MKLMKNAEKRKNMRQFTLANYYTDIRLSFASGNNLSPVGVIKLNLGKLKLEHKFIVCKTSETINFRLTFSTQISHRDRLVAEGKFFLLRNDKLIMHTRTHHHLPGFKQEITRKHNHVPPLSLTPN